jgi:hypothetical protein
MKWKFWITLVLLFLLINEYLTEFLLALLVGEMDLSSAYESTFRYFSLDSYIDAATYRSIPYVALALFSAKSKLRQFSLGKLALWASVFCLAAFHFCGYWSMQHSLFTPAHTSSTSTLAIVFIPIWALIYGVLGYALLFIGFKAYRLFQKVYSTLLAWR